MTTDRWNGSKSRKARALLAPLVAQGVPCFRCGRPITEGQAWHADHVVERWLGTGDETMAASHAHCNTSSGGKIGAAKTKALRSSRRDDPQVRSDRGPSAQSRGIRGI